MEQAREGQAWAGHGEVANGYQATYLMRIVRKRKLAVMVAHLTHGRTGVLTLDA